MTPKNTVKQCNDLRLIPEDSSKASCSNTTDSFEFDASPEVPLDQSVKVKKIKEKKDKTMTKMIQQYDNVGKLIGEKRVKVDEFGNPIKKKKETINKLEKQKPTGNIVSRDDSAQTMVSDTLNEPFTDSKPSASSMLRNISGMDYDTNVVRKIYNVFQKTIAVPTNITTSTTSLPE